MNRNSRTTWILTLALPVAGFFAISSAIKAAGVPDSEQINRLLSDVKTQAFELKEDAAIMETFSRSNVPWESHVMAINQIRDHLNEAGRQLKKLEDARATASPWQATAIDRIGPLLRQLASDTSAVIERINSSHGRIHTGDYQEYLEANADSADQLAQLISDFVNYGRTKDRQERPTNRLEIPNP
jgi:hypothetical protein